MFSVLIARLQNLVSVALKLPLFARAPVLTMLSEEQRSRVLLMFSVAAPMVGCVTRSLDWFNGGSVEDSLIAGSSGHSAVPQK